MSFTKRLSDARRAFTVIVVMQAFLGVGCYRASEATVNGDAIVQEEFIAALKLAQGHKMLQKLIIQKLIFQEAKRSGVSISEEEMTPHLQDIQKHTNDETLAKVLANEVRARLTLRRLLLKDLTEERVKELHSLFAEDLARYELYAMTTPSRTEADMVSDEIKKGTAFEVLAATHSKYKADRMRQGHRGNLTRSQISARWGPAVLEQILSQKPGTGCVTLEAEGEILVLHVKAIQSDLNSLRSSIEDLEANSRRPELIFRLLSTANITSPYLSDSKRLPSTTLFQDSPLPWEPGGMTLSAPPPAPTPNVNVQNLTPENPGLNTTVEPSPSATPNETDLQIE